MEGGSRSAERTGSVQKRCFQLQKGSVKCEMTLTIVPNPENEG